ncbi:hypothetical protein FAGKG844_40131 [Frankia sp. AgKG'84/4]
MSRVAHASVERLLSWYGYPDQTGKRFKNRPFSTDSIAA